MGFDISFGRYRFKHTVDDHPFIGRDRFDDHFHTEFELLYFIRGKADFMLEHSLYKIWSHCLLVIRPGDHHSLNITDDRDYERMVIRFSDEEIPGCVRSALQTLQPVYDISHTMLSSLFFQLDQHCQLPEGALLQELLKSSLTGILVHLCAQKPRPRGEKTSNEELHRAILFINQNLSGIQTLDDICRGLHLSRSTVNRLFSTYLQVPVMSYVRTKKCVAAHARIQAGIPPTVACKEVGFGEYSTFYRAYRRMFHAAPSRKGG